MTTIAPTDTQPLRRVDRRLPHAPQWWRDAAGAAAVASMVVVLGLWVARGGLQGLSGTAGWLTETGRLTGLVSADLLLLQVFLMARVPFVERAYGQDELARRHRLVGFWSFNLMLAHVVLITLGYAATGPQGILGTTWSLVTTYPGMLLATAATAFLCLVVVTSVRAARRRLRYESWHLLHLYAYLGVGLALPHQLWTGADFVDRPWARLYWWTAYGVAAGSVLVWRVGLPVWRTLRHRLVVDRVVKEGPGVVSVHLRGRRLDRLPVRAGQFVVLRFLEGAGRSRANPYSLSAAPTSTSLRVTAKAAGDGSGRLATLRPGTRVALEGPFGRLTGDVRTSSRFTLIGSGIGIAPLRALLEELDYAPGDATVIYRAHSEHDLVLGDEIRALAAARGVPVFHLLGPRILGRRSWLPRDAAHLSDAEGLRRLVPDVAHHDVYLCGPSGWVEAVRAAALSCGVPEHRIHVELFAW